MRQNKLECLSLTIFPGNYTSGSEAGAYPSGTSYDAQIYGQKKNARDKRSSLLCFSVQGVEKSIVKLKSFQNFQSKTAFDQ
jgi:hypothetical protein